MDQVKRDIQLWPVAWKWGLVLGVLFLLLIWMLNTPQGILGKADAVGYAVCHRIDARSFHLGERPLPLCARCSGMYLGAMLGLVFQAVVGRRKTAFPPRRVLVLVGLMGLAFAVDGGNSYLHLFPFFSGLYEPQNWLRLVTGSGMGLVIAILLYPAYNQTVWKDWVDQPALTGLRSFGLLCLLAGVLILLVLTESPLILFPAALISAVGVLVLLTMIYSMVVLMILRAENRYTHWVELLLPWTAGFGLALSQIILLDLARYLLTGTWDGFYFG